jgi:hypothetical protein
MKSGVFGCGWWVFGVVVTALGCSSESSSSPASSHGGATTVNGGTGTTGGTSGVAMGTGGTGGAATGGATSAAQPVTSIRFLQVYLNGGSKQAYDLWARKNDQSWVSLVKNLGYGQMTDYIDVPIGAGRNTMIWFIPPGSDPNKYAISIGSFINFGIEDSDTGRHTVFMFHVPGVGDWAAQLITDADPTLTPPAGFAYVAFNTDAVRPIHPLLDYGRAGACIDRAMQDNYQPIATGSYAFSLYSGAGATGCQGSVIATAPSTAFGDREVWFLYAMGDAANGFELRPVKLSRD